MATKGKCAGLCCEAFNIGSPEDIDHKLSGTEGEQVKDMLVYLGCFNRNPAARVEGQGDELNNEPVREVEAPTRFQHRYGHFHTCRHFNKESRLCSIYDERPAMCRHFPNGDPCPYEGCDYQVIDDDFLAMLTKLDEHVAVSWHDRDDATHELTTERGKQLSQWERDELERRFPCEPPEGHDRLLRKAVAELSETINVEKA